jgi:hypothetical protein
LYNHGDEGKKKTHQVTNTIYQADKYPDALYTVSAAVSFDGHRLNKLEQSPRFSRKIRCIDFVASTVRSRQ